MIASSSNISSRLWLNNNKKKNVSNDFPRILTKCLFFQAYFFRIYLYVNICVSIRTINFDFVICNRAPYSGCRLVTIIFPFPWTFFIKLIPHATQPGTLYSKRIGGERYKMHVVVNCGSVEVQWYPPHTNYMMIPNGYFGPVGWLHFANFFCYLPASRPFRYSSRSSFHQATTTARGQSLRWHKI